MIDATCPLPGCDGPLHIVWECSRPVFLDDRVSDLQDVAGAYTAGWEVRCEEGHVVLLPVNPVGAVRDVEVFGDDYHEGSPNDLDRLRALLALPTAAAS